MSRTQLSLFSLLLLFFFLCLRGPKLFYPWPLTTTGFILLAYDEQCWTFLPKGPAHLLCLNFHNGDVQLSFRVIMSNGSLFRPARRALTLGAAQLVGLEPSPSKTVVPPTCCARLLACDIRQPTRVPPVHTPFCSRLPMRPFCGALRPELQAPFLILNRVRLPCLAPFFSRADSRRFYFLSSDPFGFLTSPTPL